MNTTWSVCVERLRTRLRVGIHPDETEAQPVLVSLRLSGSAPACPTGIEDCIDYDPLCRWISEEWPRTPHVALLENRINELAGFVFGFDGRIQHLQVGLARERVGGAVSVGIERSLSRQEFEAQRRRSNRPDNA